jgi:hypothetical protein
MSQLLTLQNSINFATPILKNQPPMVSNMEPALTAANIVLGTMLGAPCRWRHNRATFSLAISTVGGVDYTKALADFGFLETQWLTDAGGVIHQLGGAVSLAKDGSTGRPTRVAPQFDDGSGTLTFRFDRIPDAAYTMNGDYQKKATLITSPAMPWGVVPDEFGYIYNWGFLCILSLLINDSRFPIFEGYFISRLLGAQDGLTDQERNIFVANWMALAQTLSRSQGSVNSGIAGRGK